MSPALLSALCELLAAHTRTPKRCWFCLWDGWGWIDGSPSVARLRPLEEGGDPKPIPPAFGPEIVDGPRVRLPDRDYILFEGPLEAAPELGWRPGEGEFYPQSPNLYWPDDHAWCVASEIDLDSTYIGGSAALARDLLSDRRFEAFPAELGDSLAYDSDKVNR